MRDSETLRGSPIRGNKGDGPAPWATMTTFYRMKHLLIVALGGLPGCLEPTDPNADDSSSSSAADTGDSTSTGAEPDTTTGTDDTTATPTTDVPASECGNGMMEADEACDDGEANADDAACTATCQLGVCGDGHLLAGVEACDDGPQNADDAACTASCTVASCGDGLVQAGVEVCDDAKNDGSYNSCAADCMSRPPHCGDGELQPAYEQCDSVDDPACLSSCQVASSCLVVHASDPTLQSGPRTIYPLDPLTPVQVICDMDSDGGGYTLLKVDIDSPSNDLPYTAAKAKAVCASHGMQLFIPRSPAHLQAAHGFATAQNVPPVGGGSKGSSADYLQILGVYPVTAGKSCPGKALTPTGCKAWAADDGQAWYISDTVKNNLEPAVSGACAGCSMSYTWNGDGTVKSYTTVPVTGGSSMRFLCDVGDKLP